MKIEYQIGTNSYTNILTDNFDKIVSKQLELNVPLITSVHLHKEQIDKKIYVGKELDLREVYDGSYWLKKYEIELEDLEDIMNKGYHKACLLNYKKYDSIIVGMDDYDESVPDYFALKKKINEFFK